MEQTKPFSVSDEFREILQLRGSLADEDIVVRSIEQDLNLFHSFHHMMSPEDCRSMLEVFCVSTPEIGLIEGLTSVVLPLHFGRLVVQSTAGLWEEDFVSEQLACFIEFDSLVFNDPAGLCGINSKLKWGTAVTVNSKLFLRRCVTLAEGRTDKSFMMEISGYCTEAEEIWSKLAEPV